MPVTYLKDHKSSKESFKTFAGVVRRTPNPIFDINYIDDPKTGRKRVKTNLKTDKLTENMQFSNFKRQPCYSFNKRSRQTILDEIVDKFKYKDQPLLDLDKAYKYLKSSTLLVPSFKHSESLKVKAGILGIDTAKKSSKELEYFLKVYDDKDKGNISSHHAFNQNQHPHASYEL